MFSKGEILCEVPLFAESPLFSDDSWELKRFSMGSSDLRFSPDVSSEIGPNHVCQRLKNSSVDFSREPATNFSQFGGAVPFLR